MSDENKLQSAIARGARADALMRDELLVEAFAVLDAEYVRAWKATPARDTEAREKLFLGVNVVGKVRQHLASIANNGKLAQRELDEITSGRRKLLGVI